MPVIVGVVMTYQASQRLQDSHRHRARHDLHAQRIVAGCEQAHVKLVRRFPRRLI